MNKDKILEIISLCIDKEIQVSLMGYFLTLKVGGTFFYPNYNNEIALDNCLTALKKYNPLTKEEIKQRKIKELENQLNELKNS